jgi:hypothetical protein
MIFCVKVWPYGILVFRGRGDVLLNETFCEGDVLLRKRCVYKRLVRRCFGKETFSMSAAGAVS